MVDPTRRRPRPIGRECNLGRQGVDRGPFRRLGIVLSGEQGGYNTLRAFARNHGETGSRETAPTATPSCRCSHSGIARGQLRVFLRVSGDCSGSREGAEEDEARPRQSGGQCAEDRLANRVSWSGFRGIRRQRRTTVRAAQPKAESTGSRCAYASRHPRYPGVIPCYPGYKTFDRAQGGDHCMGDPSTESLVIVAHGPNGAADADRWMRVIRELGVQIQVSRSYPVLSRVQNF